MRTLTTTTSTTNTVGGRINKRKRSNEAPWITHGIRKKIRMRMRIFRREGRSARWRRLKRITDSIIKQKKTEYVERMKKMGKKNGKAFYKMVKEVGCNERPKPWGPGDLYQGEGEMEIAEKISDYFGDISDLLPRLDNTRVPRDCPEDIFGDFS